MPKQLNSDYNEVSIPFAKMSFTPDVPSSALGPNEYNYGKNVETDVRGIRSTAGDQEILTTCPGTPTYISGGFRADGAGGHHRRRAGGGGAGLPLVCGDAAHRRDARPLLKAWAV